MSTEPGVDALSVALGRAIRAARDHAGISMRALALRCGVSQPFLSEVERGRSTPSIATLYRIAEALDLSPASLLPEHAADPVAVVRAHEGRRVPSSDRPNSAIGRVVFSDVDRHLEVYEYVTTAAEDLDVWFEHPGEKVLHVIEGHLAVELDGRATEHLGPGDCIIHPGTIAHRWVVEGDQPVRIFLVVVRTPAERSANAGATSPPRR